MSLRDKLGVIFNRRSTKELGVILDAVDNSLNTVNSDLHTLEKIEFNIRTATGEWLDEWGSWFGVTRNKGETDSEYSERIISLSIKPRNTIPAIIDTLKLALGDESRIYVYEPYVDIFKFSVSPLSGSSKIQDGVYSRHSVIDIYIDAPLPEHLYELIKDIKSAGVKVYFTRVNIIGGGTVLRMYSEILPKYEHFLETNMKIHQVDIHIIGKNLYGERNAFMSGRKLLFTGQYTDTEIGKIRMARSLVSSRNTTIYEDDHTTIKDLLTDDYFNAVSYDTTSELKTIMIDKIVVTSDLTKHTTMKGRATPDVYVKSPPQGDISLENNSADLYVHHPGYETTTGLQAKIFSRPFAGSMFPINTFLDMSIEDIDSNTTFQHSIQSVSVHTEKMPI